MCEKETMSFRSSSFGRDAASTRPGSRRRRLWELPTESHCPVIGVCLPLSSLRKMVGKVYCEQNAEDYAVHVAAVNQCVSRNRLSELLQESMERRHALVVQRFRAARSADAVAELWKQAVTSGTVAGAFWAGLTHPHCDRSLEEMLCREMHMIQHQAGADERADQKAFHELQKEHGVLSRELARVQDRVTQIVAANARELQASETQLMQARAAVVGRDAIIGDLRDTLDALNASIPSLEARVRLKQHISELNVRLRERDSELQAVQRRLASAMRQLDAAAEAAELGQEQATPEVESGIAPPQLDNRTVLCVGGRSGNLAHYRGIVEQEGGRFAHHDGGLKENQELLDAGLVAADLVICQTGCISHNAYWRVKEYCKRTGKLCVFVDNPSSSSFSRVLRQIVIRDITADTDR
jgi:hypothetical protein